MKRVIVENHHWDDPTYEPFTTDLVFSDSELTLVSSVDVGELDEQYADMAAEDCLHHDGTVAEDCTAMDLDKFLALTTGKKLFIKYYWGKAPLEFAWEDKNLYVLRVPSSHTY